MNISAKGYKPKVLIACEYSGVVRAEFEKRGWDATSCDLLPTDKTGKHYQGNVEDILYNDWDLIIAHPPCTYFTNSGVCWLHKDESRWAKLDDAARFFNLFLDHPKCKYIAIENPIPHKYAIERIKNRKYTQTVQPWQFGHPESKRTCFWLRGLPLLAETNNVKSVFEKLPKKEAQRLHYLPPSKDRWKIRSTTFKGIAEAMASQWGGYVESELAKQKVLNLQRVVCCALCNQELEEYEIKTCRQMWATEPEMICETCWNRIQNEGYKNVMP